MSNAINDLLDKLATHDKNTEAYKVTCVRIVERLQVERENPKAYNGNPSFGEGVWNKRPSKFNFNCGGCGEYFEKGVMAFVTKGHSPRCLDCGKPNEDEE